MYLNVLKFKYLNSKIDNFQELFLLNYEHMDVKFIIWKVDYLLILFQMLRHCYDLLT